MLNKKSAFKPKAAGVRRPAPRPASQAAPRPSTTEPSANNTPAPQESSSSQQQPAPHPAASAPLDTNPSASGNATPKDAPTPPQVQEKQAEPAVVEPAPQASRLSTPAAIEARVASVGAAKTPNSVPTAVEPEKPAESSTEDRSKAVEDTTAATSSSIDSTTSQTETPSSTTQTPNTTSSAAPALAPETASTAPDDRVHQDQPVQATAAPIEDAVSEQPQPTIEATPEPAQSPSKAAKPKRGRKRATPATPAEDSGEQSITAPPKKRLRKRAAPLPGEEGYQPAAPRATRSRKPRASAAENDDAEEDGDENNEQAKKRAPRAQRQATPPDAEQVEIDITQVKMADLAKDMHIGKKFSLHDELMERERAKRLRYNERRKRQQSGEDGDDAAAADGETPAGASSTNPADTSTQATPAATDSAAAETPEEDSNANAPIGEMYQIINGQIVLDHRSLQVDRHARAREAAGELVEIEENDFTNHTTSATYLRRNLKPQQWTDDETDLFYQALQAFGTDFDTICRMFKGKTRKHIKLKFNREERVNPQRITDALVGQKTVSIDMEQYQRATGQEYETAESIYAEQKRAEDEFEAKQKAIEDEKAEEVRRKKEEVLAQLNSAVDGQNGGGGGGGGGGDGGGGGKKGAKKGRKKKGPPVMGL